MAVQVHCPCGATYNIPLKRIGKKFRCYACARELTPGDEHPAAASAENAAPADPYAAPPAFDSDAFPQIKSDDTPSGLYQRSADTVAFDQNQLEQRHESTRSGSYARVSGSGSQRQMGDSGSQRKVAGSGSYPQVSQSGSNPQLALSGPNPQVAQSGEMERLELERIKHELEQKKRDQAANRRLYALGGLLFLLAVAGSVGTAAGWFTTIEFAFGLFFLLVGASLFLRFYQSSRENK